MAKRKKMADLMRDADAKARRKRQDSLEKEKKLHASLAVLRKQAEAEGTNQGEAEGGTNVPLAKYLISCLCTLQGFVLVMGVVPLTALVKALQDPALGTPEAEGEMEFCFLLCVWLLLLLAAVIDWPTQSVTGTGSCKHCGKQVALNCTKCPHCGGT